MSHGPIPIVVGVTGHTDLRPEDVADLTSAVTGKLTDLKTKYQHSDVLVLSPLAEGADRLVARAALNLGLRLVVAMPLEADDYKTDFADEESRAEFDELRGRAAHVFVAPYASGQPLPRPDCYAHVGAYVARHCHLLIALWNGVTPNKIGGTAEVVRHRLEGVATESAEFVRLLDATDTGVVHHIVTPRRSDPSLVGARLEVRVLGPSRQPPPDGKPCPEDRTHSSSRKKVRLSDETPTESLERICQSTDDFNKIGAKQDAHTVARREKSMSYLLPAYGPGDVPPSLEAIRALYGCADEAALHFQQSTRLTLTGLFWIGFAIFVSFEILAHGKEVRVVSEPWKHLVYLALLGAAYAVYKWNDVHKIDKKYLDYRALAESLRVEFYWRVAEVPSFAADYCMRYRLREMEWIRKALRASELLTPKTSWTTMPDASVAAVRKVAEDWVWGQFCYFARTAVREQDLLDKLERRVTIFFVVSIIAGVAAMLLTFQPHVVQRIMSDADQAHTLAVAIIGLSLSAVALIHWYLERRGLSMHIKRYERMAFIFGAALRLVTERMSGGAWAQAREALAEVGREALEENADWVMLHRERPIEMPF